MGCRVIRFRVKRLGIGVKDGRVHDLGTGFRIMGEGPNIQKSGFQVPGLGFRV
jgi:hypothetical protein